MLSPDRLTPQTRLFLAMLSTLQLQSPTPSPPPPYTAPPPTTFYPNPTHDQKPHTPPPTLPSEIDDDAEDDEDPTPTPTLHIHISAPTTIHGSHNRLVLPSPTHLSSLVSAAVKLALQHAEEGEVKEDEQQFSLTVDAGMKIEGDGNIVVLDGRKDRAGGIGIGKGNPNMWKTAAGEGGAMAGRKRRASSVSRCCVCFFFLVFLEGERDG